MSKLRVAKFPIGAVVKHRLFPFRGVVFDIDPVFANTEEWYQAIPAEVRPRRDQPFYHLFAENAETEYVAYVSEQNLLPDEFGRTGTPPAGSRDIRAQQGRQLPAARADAELGQPSQGFRFTMGPGNDCPPLSRRQCRARPATAGAIRGL